MSDAFRDDIIEVIVEEVIDTLRFALVNMFPNEIANAYFGDIVNYLPSAFLGPNQQQAAVVAIAPDFDREVEGTQTAASEHRRGPAHRGSPGAALQVPTSSRSMAA